MPGSGDMGLVKLDKDSYFTEAFMLMQQLND